jgi:hypothetical protein
LVNVVIKFVIIVVAGAKIVSVARKTISINAAMKNEASLMTVI